MILKNKIQRTDACSEMDCNLCILVQYGALTLIDFSCDTALLQIGKQDVFSRKVTRLCSKRGQHILNDGDLER